MTRRRLLCRVIRPWNEEEIAVDQTYQCFVNDQSLSLKEESSAVPN